MSFSIKTGIAIKSDRNNVQLDAVSLFDNHGIVITVEQARMAVMYIAKRLAGEDASMFRKELEVENGCDTVDKLSMFYEKLEAVKTEYEKELKKLPRYTEISVSSTNGYKFTT